jgi:hypothetical protein
MRSSSAPSKVRPYPQWKAFSSQEKLAYIKKQTAGKDLETSIISTEFSECSETFNLNSILSLHERACRYIQSSNFKTRMQSQLYQAGSPYFFFFDLFLDLIAKLSQSKHDQNHVVLRIQSSPCLQ